MGDGSIYVDTWTRMRRELAARVLLILVPTPDVSYEHKVEAAIVFADLLTRKLAALETLEAAKEKTCPPP